MKQVAVALALLLAILLIAACGGGELRVTEAWARPGNAGGNSAAYFTIHNPTNQADTLSSAHSEIASHAEIHESEMSDHGSMRMQPQDAVPVPRRGVADFSPGGLHVMLVDLKQDLQAGDSFRLTLNFETAGNLIVEVRVREP